MEAAAWFCWPSDVVADLSCDFATTVLVLPGEPTWAPGSQLSNCKPDLLTVSARPAETVNRSLTRCLGPLILSWADGKPRASGPFTTASRSSLLSQTEAPIYTYGSQRPNLVGTPEFSGGAESNWINNYFANPNVFQASAPYTLGNAPRTVGTVRSPFFFSTNLSILKEFAVVPKHEQMKLELRLEAQNAFNHPVFGTPDTYVGDPNFGVISNTPVGPRQCQLALKFRF